MDFVPAILRAFSARYPDVRVDLTEYDFGSPNGGLNTLATDVAIVRPPVDDDMDVVSTPAGRTRGRLHARRPRPR